MHHAHVLIIFGVRRIRERTEQVDSLGGIQVICLTCLMAHYAPEVHDPAKVN